MTGVLDLGALGECRIGIFKNDKAEKDQPTHRIMLLTPRTEE